jgi:hypothetical protein
MVFLPHIKNRCGKNTPSRQLFHVSDMEHRGKTLRRTRHSVKLPQTAQASD